VEDPTVSVSVIVAAHGDRWWYDLMMRRAVPSVERQGHDCELLVEFQPHGTIATARNAGAARATGSHLVFLDADDELADGYLHAIDQAARQHPDALLVPRVQYIVGGGRERPPRFPTRVDATDGNWMVIGTGMPARRFREVGGFEEWPIYEDWALFARIQKAGAQVVTVEPAVYRAHRRVRSRNHSTGRNGKLAAHDQIRRAVFPELYETETT
jgi:glycosyltransferase involved in cell wall biosynthesis